MVASMPAGPKNNVTVFICAANGGRSSNEDGADVRQKTQREVKVAPGVSFGKSISNYDTVEEFLADNW